MATWVEKLAVGSHLEIHYLKFKWCIGIVQEISDDRKRIKIAYIAWRFPTQPEWINTSTDIHRIAPQNTHIAPLTFSAPPTIIEKHGDREIRPEYSNYCISTQKCIICISISSLFEDTMVIVKYFKITNKYQKITINTKIETS